MPTDYYAVLARAIADLDSNTVTARHSLYDRARQMLATHLRAMESPLSKAAARAEQSALEVAIRRIEREAADPSTSGARVSRSKSEEFARRPLNSARTQNGELGADIEKEDATKQSASAVEFRTPTGTGVSWTLFESVRLLERYPALLLVVIQAAIVELVAPLLGSLFAVSPGSSKEFYLTMLWGLLLGLFVVLYASAGIWGSLIDATDGIVHSLRFWTYGFKYIFRSLGALLWAFILLLPAVGITILIALIGIIHTYNSRGASSQELLVTLSKLTLVVWLVDFLWASRRLLIQVPGIFASGDTLPAARIIREHGWEVTIWWLTFIFLTCILIGGFIVVGAILGFLSVINVLIGTFLSVGSFFGGAVPANPFAVPGGGLFGGAAPTIPFAIPGGSSGTMTAPANGILALSVALQFAAWILWNLLQTFLCLASLVYYRAAGGRASWHSLGVARRTTPARPKPSAPRPRPAVNMNEKGGHPTKGYGIKAPDVSAILALLRLPDFRPLLTGRLLIDAQFLAAPERSISAWPADISPRAAGAIPVIAFTLLGLASMIGRGGGLGACLVSGIIGFAFGIAALRAGAVFERNVILRKTATDIGREVSELDLSVASLGLSLGAVFTLLLAVFCRVSFVGLALISTVMLSGLSIGMMFFPVVALLTARKLDAGSAVSAAAAITASIAFAWMLLTYFV